MNVKTFWSVVKDAGSQWVADKAPRLGAALAYYTVFSLAPLLVIVIAIAGILFKQAKVQGYLISQFRDLVGQQGGEAIQAMLAHAAVSSSGGGGAALSVIMLLVGALGLFGELQDALNTIWKVKPKSGRWFWSLIRDRLLSLSMVLGTAFLLLVSLVVSAGLEAVGSVFGDWQTTVVGHVVNGVVSLGVTTLLFAMIYRFLPDVQIAWKDVWLGALITALLFTAGKFLLGLYLGRSQVASAYGAAGSFAVLLIWLYYSAQIFLFGAEFTQAYANQLGSHIVPAPHAEPVSAEARVQQGLTPTDQHAVSNGREQEKPQPVSR